MDNIIDFRKKKFEAEGKKIIQQKTNRERERMQEALNKKQRIAKIIDGVCGDDPVRLELFEYAVEQYAFEMMQEDVISGMTD